MSIKINLFYDTDKEFEDVTSRLQDLGIKVKRAEQKGKYQRAYITVGAMRSRKRIDKVAGERYNKTNSICQVADINDEYPIP